MKTQIQLHKTRRALIFIASLAALWPSLLPADLLELANGDRYSGRLVAVTQSNLVFQSEVQGKLTLPREKVARISFGEVNARPAAIVPSVAPANSRTNAAAKPPVKLDFDAASLKQVQEDLLGSASPEARRQFSETLKGLMTGSISVDDIRVQARKAVQDIKAAKQESGGDSTGVLDGYLQLLEHFLKETDGPAATTPVAPSNSTKPSPSPDRSN